MARELPNREELKALYKTFFRTKGAQHHLGWLRETENDLLQRALTSPDPTTRLALLDKAKGYQEVRLHLEGLIDTK